MTLPTLSFVDSGAGVRADLDAVVEFGIFVEGASRSGKTNVVRIFLEQTYGLFQHIVVDVEGEYVTLRSAQRPYLIVGRGRDIALPADADAIKRLVLTIVAKGVSVIFDLSEHDIEEQQPIVAAICDALVSLPENHPGNAAVVLEELQDFAPEGGGKGTALSSVRRLSKRGLKRGFFTVGVSQRVADVSKGVITQLKNKIIGGTDLKDAPRALEELGLPAKEKSAVTDLAQGDFWVKGPAFARHAQLVRPPRSVTAPPKRKRGEPPAPAPEAPAEIAALAKALAAAAVTESVSPSSTSSDVKKGEVLPFSYSNNDLQRARDEARYDEAQRHERYRRVLQQAAGAARGRVVEIQRELDDVLDGFDAVMAGIDEAWVKPVPPDPAIAVGGEARSQSQLASVRATPPSTALRTSAPASDLPRAQQAILDAIAFYASIGNPQPAKVAVGGLAGVNPKLSTWRGHMAPMRAADLVRDIAGDRLELTAAGKKRAHRVEIPSLRELQERWLSELSGPAAAILRALIAVYPAPLTREQLGHRVGLDPKLSTWRGYMAPLRKLGLVDDVGRELKASMLLFPEGLK